MRGHWRVATALGITAVSLWLADRLTGLRPIHTEAPNADGSAPNNPALGDPIRKPSNNEAARRPPDSATAPEPSGPHPLSAALCPQNMAWVAGVAVCIDLFEYPNLPGVYPAVMLDFREAEDTCHAEGKRLCTESEWTFACAGIESLPACNFGQVSKSVVVTDFWSSTQVSASLAARDGRRLSASSRCVSAHGVFDLPGNVQEWVRSEHPSGYEAALKGGRYNLSSIGCERSVQTRKPLTRLPHTGFRCCADPLVQPPGER